MHVGPTWSVIVPVYERRTYLRQCLESVLSQGIPEDKMEILVVDNASPTPGLDDLVYEIGGGRVKYHRHETNLGLYPSCNKAVQLTRGHIIHFLHEDDYVLDGFYYSFFPFNDFHPEINPPSAYYSHYLNLHPDGHFWAPPEFEGQGQLLERLALGNPLQVCAVALDRRIFEEIGYFREDLPHVADWEFWMRAALRFPWVHSRTPKAVFRYHADQDTERNTKSGRAIVDTRRLFESFDDILPPELRLLVPMARRSYARVALVSAVRAIEDGEPQTAAMFAREGLTLLSQANA